MRQGKARIKDRGQRLSAFVKDRLLPWLHDAGFGETPFFTGSGGYYPGNDTWNYYLARLETPTAVALLDVYAFRRSASIQFHYHRIALREPVRNLKDVPGPSPDHDGVLHSRHLRNHMPIHGTMRRPLGLYWIVPYRLRGFRNLDPRLDSLFERITADLGDFNRLRDDWSATRTPVTLGPDGRLLAPE
jgi:hypothetical protein